MEWLISLLGTGIGGALVMGIFAVIQHRLTRRDQKEDKAAAGKVMDCSRRGQEIDALRAMVANQEVALRAILYDRIKHIAKTHICRGWLTFEEWEDLQMLHRVYHSELQGNGFLDEVMSSVSRLEKRVKQGGI